MTVIIFLGVAVALMFLIFVFKKIKFICPQYRHTQTKGAILKEEVRSHLVHGRKTVSGKLDKRYKSSHLSYKVKTYGINCEKCGHKYTFEHDPMYESVKERDPELAKSLDNVIANLDKAIETIKKKQEQLKK